MPKPKIHFLCNNCGAVQAKWMGKCPDCGTWDSLEEYKEPAFDERAERSGKLAAEALLVLAETNVERIINQIHKSQARRRGDRLDPDDLQARPAGRAGVGHAAARLLHGAGLPGQGERCGGDLRRPRHQGGHAGGAEDHRAHRRHGRLLRGRSLPLASHRPLREEPLRQHARGRPVRDDRRRACAK
jgi:hypothetical protein